MNGEYLIRNPADLEKPPFAGRDIIVMLQLKQRINGEVPSLSMQVSRRALAKLWRAFPSLFLWVLSDEAHPPLITHIDAGDPDEAARLDGCLLGRDG